MKVCYLLQRRELTGLSTTFLMFVYHFQGEGFHRITPFGWLHCQKEKKKFSVLFIDWEVQFNYTIKHVESMRELYKDIVSNFYWVALPLKTVSGVSRFQPEWLCWDPAVSWVRVPPIFAITEYGYFPFYKYGMTFEEFVPEFSGWLAGHNSLITLIGVRTDESLSRYMGLVSRRKLRYADDKPWTTASLDGFYYTGYPLYDWKAKDIWIYHKKTKLPYNELYDLMYQAGVPMKSMRVCEPFGPEQRKGLWLYHVLEPDTWRLVCTRVAGAHSGAIYGNQSGDFYGLRKMSKPSDLSWRDYALFLLDNMPPSTAENYRCKISIYLQWYQGQGYPIDIPDHQDKDLGVKDIPSWRRICKVIIKNDYWCKMLSFSHRPNHLYDKYTSATQEKRVKRRVL